MANKVKFGLCNVYVAKCTETLLNGTWTYTYSTPFAISGAVNLSLDAQGDENVFRADNTDYYVSYSDNGYSGSLEMALINDTFKKDILGFKETTNGGLVEQANVAPSKFALMFEFDGDANKRRHVLYNCNCGRPSVSSQTTDTTITPVTESVDITAKPRLSDHYVKFFADETDSAYANWFSAVTEPTLQ